MLIRLFQQATICSVSTCRARRFRRICAISSVNSQPRTPVRIIMAACRWPDRFACPRCGHRRAYRMTAHRRWQCAACRYQVSLTAGTILHNTKTPLTVWFWATYLTVTDKRGISALLLQRHWAFPDQRPGCCCTSSGARWSTPLASRCTATSRSTTPGRWPSGRLALAVSCRSPRLSSWSRGTRHSRSLRMAVIPDFNRRR